MSTKMESFDVHGPPKVDPGLDILFKYRVRGRRVYFCWGTLAANYCPRARQRCRWQSPGPIFNDSNMSRVPFWRHFEQMFGAIFQWDTKREVPFSMILTCLG